MKYCWYYDMIRLVVRISFLWSFCGKLHKNSLVFVVSSHLSSVFLSAHSSCVRFSCDGTRRDQGKSCPSTYGSHTVKTERVDSHCMTWHNMAWWRRRVRHLLSFPPGKVWMDLDGGRSLENKLKNLSTSTVYVLFTLQYSMDRTRISSCCNNRGT